MVVINNKEEYEIFFPYSNDRIQEYPIEYPCVCKITHEEGGLMGDYKLVWIVYFPKNVTVEDAFVLGLNNKWKQLKFDL